MYDASVGNNPEGISRRFALDRPFAEGGSGAVWPATQKSLHRPVAIDVLHPGTGSQVRVVTGS